jgi:hypothetical protein
MRSARSKNGKKLKSYKRLSSYVLINGEGELVAVPRALSINDVGDEAMRSLQR